MNNKKTFLSLIIGLSLISQSIVPALAQSTSTVTSTEQPGNYNLGASRLIQNVNNMASRAAAISQNRLNSIIARANSMIATRVTALQALSTRVENDPRLTTDEKTSLTTDIQNQISSLQTLKTKIDADTDATIALADTKQIITNYYIFAVYEPKTDMLIVLNNLKTVVIQLQAMVPQLQNLITTYGQGKNTTQLQALVTDINTQLGTINTSLNNDITTIEGVSISSESTAKATFTQVRSDVSTTIRTGMDKIRSDIIAMRPLFKELIFPSATQNNSSSSAMMPVRPGTSMSNNAVNPATSSSAPVSNSINP